MIGKHDESRMLYASLLYAKELAFNTEKLKNTVLN